MPFILCWMNVLIHNSLGIGNQESHPRTCECLPKPLILGLLSPMDGC
jgi:hypothetical protein